MLTPFTGSLTEGQVKHLLSRATFGPTPDLIKQYTGSTATEVVQEILAPMMEHPEPPVDPKTGGIWTDPKPVEDVNSSSGDLRKHFLGWWMELMRVEPISVREKMTFFLHTHFTTATDVVGDPAAIYYQNKLFRHYSLGNFKELTKKVCLDNAMIKYLDGRLNEVGRPNENFARELLELYTIGKGPQLGPDDYTYFTEEDIREASRVLSGFKVDDDFINPDPDTEIPTGTVKTNGAVTPEAAATRHDPGEKVFNGALGNGTVIAPATLNGEWATVEATLGEVDELVEMIFRHEQTAIFICTDLYRFFVHFDVNEQVKSDIIIPMAEIFRDNDYELAPVLEALFTSQEFYGTGSTCIVGSIIKSPLELMVGAMRQFEVDFSPVEANWSMMYEDLYSSLLSTINKMGLAFYNPFEVAGYPAYHQAPGYTRNWISSNTLGRRYEYIEFFMDGSLPVQIDTISLVEKHVADPSNAESIVLFFIDYYFPQEVPQERIDYFLNIVLLEGLPALNWTDDWNMYKSGGEDVAVRMQLNKLLREIVQTAEYQLS